MIILEKCNIVRSTMRAMQTGVSQVEGKVLVLAGYEDGLAVVKPSAGVTNEIFAGVMYGEPTGADFVSSLPFQGEFTVNTSSQFTLPFTPISGQIRVYVGSQELASGSTGANGYTLTGKTVAVNAARNGQTASVRLNYEPTIGEVVARYGNGYPGGSASNAAKLTGVIESGEVVTDQYDVTADWSAPAKLYTGADGQITTDTDGTIIPGAYVTKLPTAGDAWIAYKF